MTGKRINKFQNSQVPDKISGMTIIKRLFLCQSLTTLQETKLGQAAMALNPTYDRRT